MREVVRSYTYVGIWMSISIAVILFNKVGPWCCCSMQHCMKQQQHNHQHIIRTLHKQHKVV